MQFDAALSLIKAQIAKATGETITMSAEQFVAYCGEQLKAAELDTDATEKAERLTALKAATDKFEADGKAGATGFEVKQFKGKAPAVKAESGSSLDDVIAKLTVKVEDMAKSHATILAAVNDVSVREALAKADKNKNSEPEVEGDATPAQVEKAARVEWSLDLAAEFESTVARSRKSGTTAE